MTRQWEWQQLRRNKEYHRLVPLSGISVRKYAKSSLKTINTMSFCSIMACFRRGRQRIRRDYKIRSEKEYFGMDYFNGYQGILCTYFVVNLYFVYFLIIICVFYFFCLFSNNSHLCFLVYFKFV